MKIKKILMTFLVAIMVIMPFSVVNVNAEETVDETNSNKVKVYIFTKDGCTYCEAQLDYLSKLAKTNDKFEVVTLRAYDSEGKQAEYYTLANQVSDYFVKKGFPDAEFTGTPLVVISDIYAAAAYSTELEEVINQAYEAGDADIVEQIRTGKIVDDYDYTGEKVFGTVAVLSFVGLIGVSIYSRVKSGPDYEEFEEKHGKEKEIDKQKNVETDKTDDYTITCKKCGYENPNGVAFCNNCGSALKLQTKNVKAKSTQTTAKKGTQSGRAGRPKKR